MSTPGSWARVTGLIIMMLSVSAGNHFCPGSIGLLLCFTVLLAGANLIAVGVRMANDPAARISPGYFAGAPALPAFLLQNLNIVGILIASCAFTAVSGEAGRALSFGMFALLLLGLSLINVGALGK